MIREKVITAKFQPNYNYATAYGLWQYDYGQILRIEGLQLPTAVEIHFSLQKKGGEAVRRIGTTQDGVTDVVIPDSMLENGDTAENYEIYVFVYLADETSGQTVHKITLPVIARPKPEAFSKPEDAELFRAAIAAVNASADRAEDAGVMAQSWAVGGTGTRAGEDADNAKYYAGKAEDALREISGEVKDAKKQIDRYIVGKEAELKGDTGNVYFAAFKVVNGRLIMYSDPTVDKVRFMRVGSRLKYQLAF